MKKHELSRCICVNLVSTEPKLKLTRTHQSLKALDAAIEAEVEPYLSLPGGAVARAKSLARFLGPRIDEAVIEATIDRLAEAWDSDEAREGIAAFLEKRKPAWAGKGD